MEKFGARAELRNIRHEKLRGRGGSSCRFGRRFGKKSFEGHCNTTSGSSSVLCLVFEGRKGEGHTGGKAPSVEQWLREFVP